MPVVALESGFQMLPVDRFSIDFLLSQKFLKGRKFPNDQGDEM